MPWMTLTTGVWTLPILRLLKEFYQSLSSHLWLSFLYENIKCTVTLLHGIAPLLAHYVPIPWEYPQIPGHFLSNNASVGEVIFNKASLSFCPGLIKASSARLPPHQYSTDLLKSRVSLGLIVCVFFFLNSSTGGKKNSPKRPKGAYFSLKLHCRRVWCFE